MPVLTGAGNPPDPQLQPAELNKLVGTVDMFTATAPVVLGGDMAKYEWTINGEPYSRTNPLHVRLGQRPTITFDNTTMMYHPIHLHGYTFQMIKADGSPRARKDTILVLPNHKSKAILVADNPGLWQLHCHNTYHQEAGVQTRLDYVFRASGAAA